MGNRDSITISNFKGLVSTGNKANFDPGELLLNENYLYLNNGGLSERGGGTQYAARAVASINYGIYRYTNGSGNSWTVGVWGDKIYYYVVGTTTWTDTGVTVTTSLKTRFEHAGFGVNRNLYGVNGTDGVIKIYTDSGVPKGDLVALSPVGLTGLKLHKSRLFGIKDDTLYYTDVNAFETWNTGSNTIQIYPGVDGYCQALEIWGDALFIFKETGVYVLPNASEADSSWSILKTDALTGTQSPDTVRRTKKGIYFLSSDNKIRVISPNISFTSGEYVMGGSGSPVVSEDIQEYIYENIDEGNKSTAFAIEFKDLYIFAFKSSSNSSAYLDKCFFADISKSKQLQAIETVQPFWGSFTGMSLYNMMVTNDGDSYLFFISDENGNIQERLNDNYHNDSGSAIQSKFQLGWFSPSGDQAHYRFNPIVVYADLETWDLNLKVDSYKIGSFLQDSIMGDSFSITGSVSSAAVGTAVVGTAVIGDIGVTSGRFQSFRRGNMVSIYGENLNVDQKTKLYKIIVYFTPIHSL